MNQLKIGEIAPEFKLLTDEQEYIQLSNLRGKWIILFFYPKDFTPTCTKEVCVYRNFVNNDLKDFKKDIIVLGISPDTVETHKEFSHKFKLSYPLLSDGENQVAKDYGVDDKFIKDNEIIPSVKRTTFIINPSGKIAYLFDVQKVNTHIEEVKKVLNKLIND